MTRAQRQLIQELEAQVSDLQAKLDLATADDLADTQTIQQLRDQVAALQTQIQALKNEVANDEATIAALEARVAELEGQLNPNPPSVTWTKTLRDTDGKTLAQFLSTAVAGDKIRLIGNFNVPSELHFPADNITLGADNFGDAKLTATQAMDDVIGVKRGPNTGQKGIRLLNLIVDSAQKATNGISAWIGLRCDNVKSVNGKMTGFHINGEGINRDYDIVCTDCDFSGNGSAAEVGHGAAGTKVFNVNGVTYIRCKANNNVGNGFWSDHDCGVVTYIDCNGDNNTERGFFREKCGRHGDPYPKEFVYGMYVPDFERLGGKVIYDGMLTIRGGSARNNGIEGILIVASPHARVGNVTFGGNGNGKAIIVRNDPNRMNPIAPTKPTEPGWMVEDIEIDKSSCTLNGDDVVVTTNVPGDKYRVI